MSPNTLAHVHELIEQLPPVQLAAVETLLESMIEDDEELTPADREAIQRGIDSLDKTGGVPMEDVLADLGMSMADLEKMVDQS
ncbi:MAG TPA: hypothetical protein VGM43_06900 [Bryobacteraceae bacterium]